MKNVLLPLALLLSSSLFAANGRPDVYVTRVFKLKAGTTTEQAKAAFEGVNSLLGKTKGFEKRNVFFDKDKGVWIDQIKWKHADAALAGMKTIEKDPVYDKLVKVTDGGAPVEYSGERAFEFEVKE